MDENLNEVPDFSGDDFANDKEIVKAREEAKAQLKMIEDSLAIVKSELNATEELSDKNFTSFLMFNKLGATVLQSFQSNSRNRFIVSVVEYVSSYPIGRGSNRGSDKYLFGYLELPKTFPPSYICKESIPEKIMSLFQKTDVDFVDYKKFSRKFNVITKDGDRFADLVRFKNLDDLTKFPEMEVEIHENSCLFRNSRRPISPVEATEFSSLAKALADTFN